MVVRAGELLFMSPQQQHEFNFPYQIGSPDSMADTPHAAQVGRAGAGRAGQGSRVGRDWMVVFDFCGAGGRVAGGRGPGAS